MSTDNPRDERRADPPDHTKCEAESARPGASTTSCPLCGIALEARHCKLLCRNCGYREDCSDLFPTA